MTDKWDVSFERVDSNIKTSARAPRAPYFAPILRKYGSVSSLTAGGTGTGIDGPQVTMMVSDRQLKEDVRIIGAHPLGIGLYLFAFKPEFHGRFGVGRQFGVMADEVEQVMPQAVSVHPDGYKMVDYAMLGIRRHLQ